MVRIFSKYALELDIITYRNCEAESATNPGRHLRLRFLVLRCLGPLFDDIRKRFGDTAMQGMESKLCG